MLHPLPGPHTHIPELPHGLSCLSPEHTTARSSQGRFLSSLVNLNYYLWNQNKYFCAITARVCSLCRNADELCRELSCSLPRQDRFQIKPWICRVVFVLNAFYNHQKKVKGTEIRHNFMWFTQFPKAKQEVVWNEKPALACQKIPPIPDLCCFICPTMCLC